MWQQNGFHLEYELANAHQNELRDERARDQLAQQATTQAMTGRRRAQGIPMLVTLNFGRSLRIHLMPR